MTTNMIIVYVALMAISALVGWWMGHRRGTEMTIAKMVANNYIAYRMDEATGHVSLIKHPEARNGR